MPLIPNSSVVFPQDARPDRAFWDYINIPANPGSNILSHVVPGDWFELVLTIEFALTTGAVVANRAVYLIVKNADGSQLIKIPSQAVQPANVQYTYRFLTGLSSPYTSGNNDQTMALPPFVFQPGQSYGPQVVNFAAGDSLSFVNVTAIKVPSGPRLRPETVPLALPLVA